MEMTDNHMVKTIALAGNPNAGKSTIFNALTGSNQHTGKWPGKTSTCTEGYCESPSYSYVFVDTPSIYSLIPQSPKEEITRNFICFGHPDAIIAVCSGTHLERSLNLVLQLLEISSHVIVCINFLDEAERKGININLPLLSKKLGIPVIGTIAKKKDTLTQLLHALDEAESNPSLSAPFKVRYPYPIERAIYMLEPMIEEKTEGKINSRWLCLKLLYPDASFLLGVHDFLGDTFLSDAEIVRGISVTQRQLSRDIENNKRWEDEIVKAFLSTAKKIYLSVTIYEKKSFYRKFHFLVRIFIFLKEIFTFS